MKRTTPAALAILTGILVLTAGCSHTTAPAAAESTGRYIVQASDLAAASAAVAAVGGTITHELRIINAVGATLTLSQLEALESTAGITVHADRNVAVERAPETDHEVTS